MSSRIENDEMLLSEVKELSLSDDPRAISLLYKHYYQRLITFAGSIVKTREAAEEVVEDVLIKLWASKTGLSQVRNLKLYLFSAVRNQSLNYLEKELRFETSDLSPLEGSIIESSGESPLEHLILSEMSRAFQIAVESLPERCQLIFRLVREEGFKYKEVAEILNISVNTIDNQMAIAVRRICAALYIKKPETTRYNR
jgi:RNA polymerase sigma-70 factor (family 1)